MPLGEVAVTTGTSVETVQVSESVAELSTLSVQFTVTVREPTLKPVKAWLCRVALVVLIFV